MEANELVAAAVQEEHREFQARELAPVSYLIFDIRRTGSQGKSSAPTSVASERNCSPAPTQRGAGATPIQ
jgi:hypothetical protein